MALSDLAWRLAAGLLLAGAAQAEVVNFEFSGTIAYGDYLAQPGATIVGTFAWDADARGGKPVRAAGTAEYDETVTRGMTAKLGAHTITSENLRVTVSNDLGTQYQDLIDMRGLAPVVDGTTYPDGMLRLRLASSDRGTHVFADTGLPRQLPVHRFVSIGFNGGQLNIGPEGSGMLLVFSIDTIRQVHKGAR